MNQFSDFPSGLMTDYEFYVTDAKFVRDAQYNQGQTTQLLLTGKAIQDGVLVNELMEEKYNCPKDWVSTDEGMTVHHSGSAKNFNRNSQVAKLFLRVTEVAPGLVDEWVRADASPQEAAIWLGTSWHMAEVTETFKINGEDRSVTRNFPDAYLGRGDGPGVSGDGEDDRAGTELDMVERLRPLALAHGTHEDFCNAAIALEGISSYTGLIKRIADPDDLYKELRAAG